MPTAGGLELSIEPFTLENGLRVFLHLDAQSPLAAVQVWYHAGAKDDGLQKTGRAHLFEHLMFEGSGGYDHEYFRPLQEAGGSINGSTSPDRTNYYEVVPSNFLERALWMEADRMGRVLETLTDEKLETQRSVVINERKESVENQPYGRVHEELMRRLYPSPHPYSWPVIGWMEHLESMTKADVEDYWQRYYRPSNATLVVAGSYDRDQARRWIERSFGAVPDRTAKGALLAAEATPLDDRPFELEEPVALPRLEWCWRTVPALAADEPALDFAAEILGGRSKDARLKRRLVHEERLAASAAAYHSARRLSGLFGVRVYALPASDVGRIRAIVEEEIARLAAEPATEEEMVRVRRAIDNLVYAQLETVLHKSSAISYQVFHAGEVHPGFLAEEVARYHAVTPEQVRQAAAAYLLQPVVKGVVKKGGEPPSVPARSAEHDGERPLRPAPDLALLPGPGPTPPFRIPHVERWRTSAGLDVWLASRPGRPRVFFELVVSAGAASDPLGRSGLARLTADVVDEGSAHREGLEIARILDRLGASLSVGSGVEVSSVTMATLRETMRASLELFAEVVVEPSFREADVERERARLLAGLAHRRTQPEALADDAFDAAVFGEHHPYGRPRDGREEEVRAIAAADLAAFHRERYRPGGSTLVVVGDVRRGELEDLLDESLGSWPAGEVPPALVEPTPVDPRTRVVLVDRPGSAQSVLRVGRIGVARGTPDYYRLLILNTILGGQFTSRLNMNLREAKGFTYGVRSGFTLRRRGGHFSVETDVGAAATVPALVEIVREVLGPLRDLPITREEMAFAKAYLVRRFPARFESNPSLAGQLAYLAALERAPEELDRYIDEVASVTLDDVGEAAAKHLAPAGMRIVLVGDAAHAAGLADALGPMLGDIDLVHVREESS